MFQPAAVAIPSVGGLLSGPNAEVLLLTFSAVTYLMLGGVSRDIMHFIQKQRNCQFFVENNMLPPLTSVFIGSKSFLGPNNKFRM